MNNLDRKNNVFSLNILNFVLRCEKFLHPRIYNLLLSLILPFYTDNDGLITVSYNQLKLRVNLLEGADRQIYMHAYDPPLSRLIEKYCREGDIVIDVGANAGALTVRAANKVGRKGKVIAVEPNPSLLLRLKEIAASNPLKNIITVPDAIGEREGIRPFYISSSHPYSTLDSKYLPNYPVKDIINMAVRTLESLAINEANGNHVRLIKLDVQGNENIIILSSKSYIENDPPDMWVIEVVNEGIVKVIELMKNNGYLACQINNGVDFTELVTLPKESTNLVFVKPSCL